MFSFNFTIALNAISNFKDVILKITIYELNIVPLQFYFNSLIDIGKLVLNLGLGGLFDLSK